MEILKNTTEGIYPYQQALYQKVMADGFKKGTMFLISAGRGTGKSMLNQYYGKMFNNNLCQEILLPMQPKSLKYKFTRSNWYVAEFDWVHQAEVLEWCKQQFGPHPQNPNAWSRWFNKYSEKIHFRDEKDYAWFCLKWS